MDNIQDYIAEIIEGNDSHIEELRRLIKEFFEGKEQKDIDLISKDILVPIKNSYNILFKKAPLSEIDRAFLEVYNREKTIKYFYVECFEDFDKEKLDGLILELKKSEQFTEEQIRSLSEMITDCFKQDNWWNDDLLLNKTGDLQIMINFDEIMDKPMATIEIIGRKKYEKFAKDLINILKP